VSFNPNENFTVANLKSQTAKLIDLCETLRDQGYDPRAVDEAQKFYDVACMYAVKAATSIRKQ